MVSLSQVNSAATHIPLGSLVDFNVHGMFSAPLIDVVLPKGMNKPALDAARSPRDVDACNQQVRSLSKRILPIAQLLQQHVMSPNFADFSQSASMTCAAHVLETMCGRQQSTSQIAMRSQAGFKMQEDLCFVSLAVGPGI